MSLTNETSSVQTPAPASAFKQQLELLLDDVGNLQSEAEEIAAQCGLGGPFDSLKEIARRAAVADDDVTRSALKAAQRFEQAAGDLDCRADELRCALWALQDATAA